jgi:ABC-type branched-subunit amino acid transport system ATPase component
VATLETTNVTKRFAGVTALQDVSIELGLGQIHGLIGPNGSGKTTLLNLLSGYYKPTQGYVGCDGADLTGASVQRRTQLGIARTFQKPRILESLRVVDNVMIGGWRRNEATFLETLLGLPRARREHKRRHDAAVEILRGLGLGYAQEWLAGRLSHAERRFVEIARALALGPRFVLLDEPAGGLTAAEIGELRSIVTLMASAGIGVLLIEHHTQFVFEVSQRVTVLNFGNVIKSGRPDEVQRDAEVIRVYLGA